MKAITVTDQSLIWEEHPDLPEPGPDEVAIDVTWAGMNRADLVQRKGAYPPPPGASPILGLEVSGRVAAVGENVSHLEPGTEVCALLTGGGYASRVNVPSAQVLPVPDGLTLEQAAALPEVFATAWMNLYMVAGIRPGERVLLHAAASGVGTAAIQLAKAMGNPVFATAGSDDKLAFCRELGADGTWNRHQGSFAQAVKDWGGADMVLDPVGGDYIAEDQKCLNVEGRIILIGRMAGTDSQINTGLMLMKRQRLIGSTLRAQPVELKGEVMDALYEHVWPKLASGDIKPIIDRTWPITEADEAMAYLESNESTGKLLLAVNP
ncbi:putative NAD(P)H quinone oxidoreductase, PIG3 family [Marinobacter daqiaonensis]|uniref:Putative NAD(P)H quinone oxidoreductase, PIG3 family n=1 Tax=Marinobacter daqiaonensis TaxID=650891 RepID=A0A1I6IKA5_9GAMM|nr:NAD(P)H-quinone oxidoreductase [Marinobacter daqiaonensis]SFR67094.1 putative NAD(P)H quinone oxidoreductase, PIG3 family [Marinobacter daqiaonensis]